MSDTEPQLHPAIRFTATRSTLGDTEAQPVHKQDRSPTTYLTLYKHASKILEGRD